MVKGLANIVEETDNSLIVKLNFEPNREDDNDIEDEFYVQENQNRCVICGKDKEYSRFHIVPSVYRTHLPESMKSHRSHDVVLFCFDCLGKALAQ